MKEIKIPKKGTHMLSRKIDTAGDHLVWKFCTRKYGIGFGLYYRLCITNSDETYEKKELIEKLEESRKDLQLTSAVFSIKKIVFEDLNLIEILPLRRFKSSKGIISGTYPVPVPGEYVIRFDNTFSTQKTKNVFYTIDYLPKTNLLPTFNEGWIYLKRDSILLHGWIKKWAIIHENSILTLGLTPKKTQKTIDLKKTTISLATNKNEFLINDGGIALRFKSKTSEEYEKWSSVLKKCRNSPEEKIFKCKTILAQMKILCKDKTEKEFWRLGSELINLLEQKAEPVFYDVEELKDETIETFYDMAIEEQVKRGRTKLPAKRPKETGFVSFLFKNIGKDIESIQFPIDAFEPLTSLQRMCEEFEHIELICNAAKEKNKEARLAYVVLFALSGYSSMVGRTGKPFNPLLGETFEYTREDMQVRFIAEKIGHKPLTMAAHMESLDKSFVLWAERQIITKTSMPSIEITAKGDTHLVFLDTNDHFVWKRAACKIKNVFSSNKTPETYGDLEIKNTHTGDSVTVSFKKGTMFYESKRAVHSSFVCNENKYTVDGAWDSSIKVKRCSDNQPVCSWRRSRLGEQSQYGFGDFALSLNEMTSDVLHPTTKAPLCAPTDSRLRPDLRYFEEGMFELAEKKKTELETLQRQRRVLDPQKPRWFEEKDGGWIFTEEYWDLRQSNGFDKTTALW